MIRAFFHRIDGRFDRSVSRDDDDDRFRRAAFDLFQEFDAAHAGHPQIGQHDIERGGFEQFQSFDAAARRRDIVALIFQNILHDVALRQFVLDNQNFSRHNIEEFNHKAHKGHKEDTKKNRKPLLFCVSLCPLCASW